MRKIYQLKITLDDIRPPIWRRFQVWSDISFHELHKTIQVVMGWQNYHLYEFQVNKLTFVNQHTRDEWDEGEPTETTPLDAQLKVEGNKFLYQYDFGDSWNHELILEQILSPVPDEIYPHCIKGKRACPPEDCGGTWGYMNLLEVLKDSSHPERGGYLEWLGGEFNPEAFNVALVNKDLQEGVFWNGELVASPLALTQPFTQAARHIWDTIPEQFRVKLLSGSYCTRCRAMTTIIRFKGHVEKGDLILQGQCVGCGHPVARVVERE